MSTCVVDASIVAAAFFQEEHAPAAQKLLASKSSLHAPDLIYAEIANVIWKRHQRREIDELDAQQLLLDVLSLPLQITSSEHLLESALPLAMHTRRTVYDSLYLALAVRTNATLITADRRLVNALSTGPFAKHIAWIGSA